LKRSSRRVSSEVELQGDGFLLAFASVSRALDCAIDIQKVFAAYGAEHSEQQVRVRIGIHAGEPSRDADRFFGKTVILASRLAGKAQGGEIFVSSPLFQLKISLPWHGRKRTPPFNCSRSSLPNISTSEAAR
jgi:class 3 adenylate cyclase